MKTEMKMGEGGRGDSRVNKVQLTKYSHETLAWTVFPTARFLRNSRDWKANGSSPSLLRRGAEMKAREKTRSSEGLLVLVRIRVSPLSTDLTLAKKAMMETSQWAWMTSY